MHGHVLARISSPSGLDYTTLAPNQIPALVLEDGLAIFAVKVRAASVSYDSRKKAIKCVNGCTAEHCCLQR